MEVWFFDILIYNFQIDLNSFDDYSMMSLNGDLTNNQSLLNKKAMKNFTKTTILALTALLFSVNMFAQRYNTAIGVRLGGVSSGVSIKHFTAPQTALEGIVGFGYKSIHVTGLLEKHVPISSAPGLSWLYGGGAHVGIFSFGGHYYYVKNNRTYVLKEGDSRTIIGLDLILGLDYKFSGAPFNISLDVKPFVDFFEGTTILPDAAISLRFAF